MRNTDFYIKRIKDYNAFIEKLNHKLRIFTWLRLIFFLSAILIFYLLFSISVLYATIAAGIVLGLFVWSILRYNKTQNQKKFNQRLVDINQGEIEALQGNYHSFGNGAAFLNPEHPYTFDMDIFGEGSLFQFLNRTRSSEGESRLAALLSNCEKDKNTILHRQETTAELSDLVDFRQNFLASFSLANPYPPGQKQQLFDWLFEKKSFFKGKTLSFLSFALPVLFFLLFVLSIVGIVPGSLLLYAFLLNLGVVGMKLKETNHIHARLSEHGTRLKEYAAILKTIEKQEFKSVIAADLKSSLHHKNQNSSVILKKLGSLVDLFDNRLNIVVNIGMNGLFLWDFHCIRRLEKWKNQHRNSITQWFHSISLFEAYISMANMVFNYPENAYPEFAEDETFLSAENVGHPLINPSELVRNNFHMHDKNFIIITGANMAGKSTFLRIVGINMVLAMAGCPVCADRFVFKPVQLFTSMRTSDSLQKNESYFYAELKRLKDLLQMLTGEEKVMIILDEILKGTNSEDKQKGSKMFLEQLVKRNATGIIATHDLALAALEEKHQGKIANYCFEIEIDGENIHFDYKLKKGVTQKMNASILMEQMGLLTGS